MDILNNQYITYDNIIGLVNVDIEIQKNMKLIMVTFFSNEVLKLLKILDRSNVYLDNKPDIFGGFVIRGKKIGNYYPELFQISFK